ncbi:hypothetical protein OUY22_24560, partial [Nonomuraea sp. MCN248]|nr:hypothetical protein [Nonomuraea corallina]
HQTPPAETSGGVRRPRASGPMPPAETSGRFPRPRAAGRPPHPHLTGQGPLPPRTRPAKPGRSVFTGCLVAGVVLLMLLALLVAALLWRINRLPDDEAGTPVQGKLTLTVSAERAGAPGTPPA